MSLILTRATTIVEAALRKRREMGGAPLAVAGLDAGGHLKAFAREDGAAIARGPRRPRRQRRARPRRRWGRAGSGGDLGRRDGQLVAGVGIVVGAAVAIGGVGSVKTHPRAQGRGCATAGLRFYERLGWCAFPGRLLVEQPTGRTEFTINRPMVLAGRRPAPEGGVIDLHGPPW